MNQLQPELKSENASYEFIKRLSAGAVAGVLIGTLFWSYTDWFGHPQPLIKGIIGCLGLAIVCGLMTYKWGYKTLETLLELLP